MSQNKLRIGLPCGSLQEATLELFAKAGYRITLNKRSYKPAIDDRELEVRLLRAQEISRYVERGFLDCGITGKDWIEENGSNVAVLGDLIYSKGSSSPIRWVLVVPENSRIQRMEDLAGKLIATEAVGITRRFLQAHGIEAAVEFSWGATEVKVPELVDAIVEITETGASLQANNLRILEVLIESYPQIIANHAVMQDAWKKTKLQRIFLLLQGALNARDKRELKMNFQESKLIQLLARWSSPRNPPVPPSAPTRRVPTKPVFAKPPFH